MSEKEPLSTWRFRLETHATTHDSQAEDEGRAFRAVRRACKLTTLEVAIGWRVAAADIDALEAGRRAFPKPQDLRAALSQLWLWGSERGVRG